MSSAFGKSRLPQVASQGKVIWRHPHGRFDVIEYLGKSPLGTQYRIREAVLTPERDVRGIMHKKKPPRNGNSASGKEK